MSELKVKNVVVAGPGGTLCKPVINRLVEDGFNVSVLTRDAAKVAAAGYLPVAVKLIEADYTSVESLKPALQGGHFDSIIILINRNMAEAQIVAIDAAIAAGIPHVVPSNWGLDMTQTELRKVPSLIGKFQMEDHLAQKVKAGLITYTSIVTGLFLDWALEANVVVNFKGGPTPVFDGGDVEMSATTMADIAKAVSVALQKHDESKNMQLMIHSAVLSQNKLLEYAQAAAPGREFPIVPVDTAELEKEAWEEYNAGNRSVPTMRKFLVRCNIGLGLALHNPIHNELLGIETMGEEAVKLEVARAFARFENMK